MTRRRIIRLDALAVMLVLLGVDLLAEPAPAEPARSGRPRSEVSARITEALLAKLPRYKAPAPDRPAEARESPDGTLVLPTMTIIEKTVLPPPEAVITPKARLEQALKDHPGLKLGNLFGLNGGIALAMQREDREARKKAALDEVVQYLAVENTPEAKKLKAEMRAAKQVQNQDWLAGPRR